MNLLCELLHNDLILNDLFSTSDLISFSSPLASLLIKL